MEILQVPVRRVEQPELVEWILSAASQRRGGRLTYLTAWSLVLAQRDPAFLERLRDFNMVYSDGMGVVLAACCLGARPLKKVTANDFIFDLCREFSNRGLTIALVGGKQCVVDTAAARLAEAVPQLNIVLRSSGYFSEEQECQLKSQLIQVRPDVIIVGMGQPFQEAFVCRSAPGFPNTLFYCVGGLFDVIAGVDPTPPHWVRNCGLEWLFRLVTRPRQVWRRYLIGIPQLALYVVRSRLVRLAGIPLKK